MNWISVKDRLPATKGEFIVCEDVKDGFTEITVRCLEWHGPKWGWRWGGTSIRIDTVTHWMPLPEPPIDK